MGDARILAPPARADFVTKIGPSPEDEKLMLLEENRRLREDINRAHIATRTMASVAVTLARMLAEADNEPLDREVILPRDHHEKMAGAEVGVRENAAGDLIVRIVDNVKHPVWEGR
jgi:hypothetical protein